MVIKTEADLEKALHRRGYIKRLVNEAADLLIPVHNHHWAKLAQLSCTDWDLGRWVEYFDLDYLKYCLMEMPESEFSEAFNSATDTRYYTPVGERSTIYGKISEHITVCPRCKMKQQIDRELDELVSAEYTSQLAKGGANEPDNH